MSLLSIVNIVTSHGMLKALSDVSMELSGGEIAAVIGPNGSGKTTLLNTVCGLVHPSSGAIVFRGEDVTSLPIHYLCRKGISLVPEGRQLFGPLTVAENLALGIYPRRKQIGRQEFARDLERVYSIFPVLRERRKQAAGILSGGQQQMLAIGRALMAKPLLLLLDEPSHGLAPLLVKEVLGTLVLLTREEKLSILLAEQDAKAALGVADRGYLLQNGKVILEGAAKDLAGMSEIQAIYLGTTNAYRREQ